MRILLILPCLFLAGCAGIAERALSGQTASAKLRSELGADIDLRFALQKDLARKNAQLEYVSDGGYSCGPNDRAFRNQRTIDWNPRSAKQLADRKKAREKFLRSKYGDLEIILAYGDALSSAIKDRDTRKNSFALFQKVVDSYSGFVPPEFAFAPKAIKSAAGLGAVVVDNYFKAAIIKIAADNEAPLKKARDQIVAKGIAKALTETEDKAFKDWDRCALDRLFFLREYNPRTPPDYINANREKIIGNTVGESRSPVLDFITEYTKYLDEREAFIGQRPDYIGAIDTILASNSKIAHLNEDASLDDFMKALIEIGGDASTAYTEFNNIQASLGAASGG